MGQSRDQHRPLLGIEGGRGRGQAEAGEELALYTVQVQYYRTYPDYALRHLGSHPNSTN